MINQVISEPAQIQAYSERKPRNSDQARGFLDLLNGIPAAENARDPVEAGKSPAATGSDKNPSMAAKNDARSSERKNTEAANPNLKSLEKTSGMQPDTDTMAADPEGLLVMTMKQEPGSIPNGEILDENAGVFRPSPASPDQALKANAALAESLEKLKLASAEKTAVPGNAAPGEDGVETAQIKTIRSPSAAIDQNLSTADEDADAMTQQSLKPGIGSEEAAFDKTLRSTHATGNAPAGQGAAEPSAMQGMPISRAENRKTKNVPTDPATQIQARKGKTGLAITDPSGKPQDTTSGKVPPASTAGTHSQVNHEKAGELLSRIEDPRPESASSSNPDTRSAPQPLTERFFHPGAEATKAMARPAPSQPPAILQVSVQIERALAQGEQQFRITMRPAELGHVSVRLQMEGSRLKAYLSAERPETLELLQRESRWLERALTANGIDITSDNLQFSLEQGGSDPRQEDNADAGNFPASSSHMAGTTDQTDSNTTPLRPTVGLVDVMI